MHVNPLPVRKGRAVCFNLDADAEQLLRAMVLQGRGFGAFLGELIRKEALIRGERHTLLETLRGQQPEAAIVAECKRALG
jgi:hypothetical protein